MDNLANKASELFANTFVIATVMLFSIGWGVAVAFGFIDDGANLLFNLALSIITLLVAMLLQKTQTRDTKALHAKLDELIKVIKEADDNFIGLEKKNIKEIEEMKNRL